MIYKFHDGSAVSELPPICEKCLKKRKDITDVDDLKMKLTSESTYVCQLPDADGIQRCKNVKLLIAALEGS